MTSRLLCIPGWDKHCLICGERPASTMAMDVEGGGMIQYSLCGPHWERFKQENGDGIVEEIESALLAKAGVR